MNPRYVQSKLALLLMFTLIVPILAACGSPVAQDAPIREPIAAETTLADTLAETTTAADGAATTETATTAADGAATTETATAVADDAVETTTADAAETVTAGASADAGGEFSTPHPILNDVRVRQAIAYCTNRPELIKSVYPFADEEQQKKLLMDTNLPQGHWALATEGLTTYAFSPEQGNKLLDEAGWTQAEEGSIRTNANGDALALKFLSTNAQFRQTWATVLEQQLSENCGIQLVRTHAPASYVFGDTTGLARRDFELAAYAWVGEPDPGGDTLYACNQIPLPSNNWEGQNAMGWCNETASKAIIAANNLLDREARKEQFATFQQEFTKDMVSLPLFNRLEAAAASNNLQNFKPDSTEYVTANAGEWVLEGGDEVVMGFTQEPASLFGLVESAAVTVMVNDLIGLSAATTYNYDYQPQGLKELPTIENGGATNADVEVKAGDTVWSTDGEAVELKAGVEVLDSTGQAVTYEDGTLTLKQLSVNFEFIEGVKWEDGEPLKQADFQLAEKINCDPESGATTFTVCESREKVDYTSDNAYTVTYLPGVQWPEYFVYTVGAYPSHQKLSDGRVLADVPAAEWATLPEIAEKPLSNGPYKLVEWQKGQRMVFEANENYVKGAPQVKSITIQFFEDTNQAVAQLLTGDIDVLDPTTLGAGPELETVLKAGEEGQIQASMLTSPTWEHIDMNLFVK